MSTAGTTSIFETQDKARHRPTYASFGENGLTATATAYGHLLQITQYFGNDPSGFYCVDLKDVPEPYLVTQRMEHLQSYIVHPDKGMRLEVENFNTSELWDNIPKLSFPSNRWPKFESEAVSGNFSTEIQYFIHQKAVYQTYTFTSCGESSASLPEMAFNAELLIRNLDFSNSCIWNMQEADNNSYKHRSPQRKDCILRIHEIGTEQDGGANQTAQNNGNAVVLAIWPFIGDSPQSVCPKGNTAKYKIIHGSQVLNGGKNESVTVTLVYTLHFGPSSQVERDILPPSPPMELLRKLKADAETTKTPFAKPLFPDDGYLGIALKRNLEHMLSVCCIPVRDSTEDKIPPIAITCGDMAGHRAKYGSSLPQKSLMETPFHIIKVAEFCRITKDKNALEEMRKNLGNTKIIGNWVKTLDRENKHGLYAFPRPRKEAPIHSFYFPDHAIIWWAAKSVEYLGLGQELQIETSACAAKHKPRNMSYSSDDIRTNIIKRFTTENPVLKKRMIAISRNTIETRFLIREKEIVLFSALDQGLLDESLSPSKSNSSEKIDVWANTMACQAQHEDNQNTQWDHPLQFALAIIMSSNGIRINSKPSAEMMHHSKTILLNSSSLNGLFPGQLDGYKEPAIFMKDIMCDSYWRVTFEVPYILWKYSKASSTSEANNTGYSNISTIQASTDAQSTKPPASYITSTEFNQAFDKLFEHLNAAFFSPGLSTTNGKLAIKKSVPFKTFIDQNNIVELPDEWMYTEPKFFDFNCNLSRDCNLSEVVYGNEVLAMSKKETFHRVGNVIANAIDLLKQDNKFLNPESPIMGYIVDVPRGSPANREYTKPLIISNPKIYEYVGGKRTPELSKKRLFHFFKADLATALICYLASSEKSNISSFFDRHAAYDKYFFDDVTPETNKWVTEFHLSFYRILARDISKPTGIPLLEEINYPHPRLVDGRRISRAVISFRFDGDYFDRYWTCHFFEFNPKELSESKWEPRKVVEKHFGAISKANPWRQRRVLELLIVGSMLQEILFYSQEILEEIKKSIQNSAKGPYRGLRQQPPASALLDTFDLFTKIDNGRFVAISRLWYKFQHILQIVENDLQENLAKITLWNDRERARGHDKPRWTKSDERDYRPIISKLQANNNHKYHELQRCYVNITSFNASLSTNLDKMRGDLELRGADDIRLMSDTPSRHTLISMAVTAVIAILVTVIALTNAKTLDNKIVSPILRSSRRTLYSSVGRPLKIIYSALKIRFRPCVYYFARYVYFPFLNQYTGSGLVMELMEEFGRELFEMADSVSPWEHAYEDYSKTMNKMRTREGEDEEQDWGYTIGKYTKTIPQRMSVRFRGGNKATAETDPAAGSVLDYPTSLA
ncbi:hypothetical protein TRIATDRAFT_53322 [Trichoderma atroviride IMI 206040]|uniref:Uncharacterized protein n=1 Tax=Hypocrea atroviridis (strain ATCC 20476 / IMI 206040) TaxID=452589 RepID=G9NL58_HYPAI|nr:uncharacterized protein TRIATDRAFT_53322 [Trichoderma atroviride IMI 206040]EHK48625.1 hypothetical protein TRIATDRAFT_53322 [Trichoderma atroviride IMI 206040]